MKPDPSGSGHAELKSIETGDSGGVEKCGEGSRGGARDGDHLMNRSEKLRLLHCLAPPSTFERKPGIQLRRGSQPTNKGGTDASWVRQFSFER